MTIRRGTFRCSVYRDFDDEDGTPARVAIPLRVECTFTPWEYNCGRIEHGELLEWSAFMFDGTDISEGLTDTEARCIEATAQAYISTSKMGTRTVAEPLDYA